MHIINELLLEHFGGKIDCFERLLVLFAQLNVFGGSIWIEFFFQTLGLGMIDL